MVNELEPYIESDGLYRQVVVKGSRGTLKPNMSIGLILDYYTSLERDLPNMLPRERMRLQEVISRFETFRDTHLEGYTAKLRLEIKASLDSWSHFVDGCRHGEESCWDDYPTEVWLRSRLHQLLTEARGLGMDVTEETTTLHALDDELNEHFQPGEYVGAKGGEVEHPSDVYWWLYGRPVPAE
jgi:hypothetical protein